ncbi:MAG: hypothetical protein Kow0040_14750 [Thermogutta sp.]
MDGAARTTGELFRTLWVGDKEYRLATPRIKDLACLEAELLSRLPDPIEQAAKAVRHVPPGLQDDLWKQAFEAAKDLRRFEFGDLDRLPPIQRLAACAFLVLHRHHGDEIRTLDDAIEWLTRAGDAHSLEDISAAVEAASTEATAKKSATPTGDA